MKAENYVAAVEDGTLFPDRAVRFFRPSKLSGETAEMWVKVDPGQYILVCWNSGGGKSRARSTHLPVRKKVGVREVRPPKEDLVWKLFDYRFELSGDLRKGVKVIRIETPGPAMHEVDIYRLHEGKTVANLNSWRKQQGHGPAPAEALGGALDSHDISRVVWLRKKFVPGRYVLHCEMPSTNTELTHADGGDEAGVRD